MEVCALIIAVGGEPRNPNILGQLMEICAFKEIEIFHAIIPEVLEPDILKSQILQSSALLSREITEKEVATKFSHEQAYRYAKSKNWKNLMVFEDDVEVRSAPELKNKIEKLKEFEKPIIYSFYSPSWSVWRRNGYGLISLFPPPGAVAYIINGFAMEKAISGLHCGLADWPTWSRKIDFYLIENSAIDHARHESFLETEREKSKFYQSAFAIRVGRALSSFSSNQIYFTLVYPAIWKIAHTMQYSFGLRTKTDYSRIILSIERGNTFAASAGRDTTN